jgi:glycosyltransferase involved in cell wall biosynthesis
MKIVFVHRRRQEDRYSIENVFQVIARELGGRGENVAEYQVGTWSDLISDVLALRKLKADVYHVTGDVNYFVLFLPWNKTVLTVHDIGHYLFGLVGLKRWIYKWVWLLLPMKYARLVTVVSVATKEHCVRFLNLKPKKINVIENCVNPAYRSRPSKFNTNAPRILQVGVKPYKNVPRLIRALQGIPCLLVLVGELDAEIIDALSETAVKYENHVGLSLTDLVSQYFEADMASFVSIGEGFGLPIIEAQAMGLPLITANIPPMSVAAGGGAYLADPQDIESIREGVLKIINDNAYRAKIVEKGFVNVALYSVEAVAKDYLAQYRTIVGA